MAEVFLGTRTDNEAVTVALKVPLGSLPPEVDAEMFLREAEAAARIDHPNVVRVIDWGDSPPFIAFEYVEGKTFDRVLSERQSTGAQYRLEELLPLFRALAAGMAAINEQLVHRDLKPANIFNSDTGPRISDFGLAKYIDEATRTKTFKGWGSLPYMAPETFRGESADWRSDQYSLGVVFHELATLARPFHGDGAELERQHLFVRPPRLTQARPDLPEALATVVE
jgi:serine/threonine-protein kinase